LGVAKPPPVGKAGGLATLTSTSVACHPSSLFLLCAIVICTVCFKRIVQIKGEITLYFLIYPSYSDLAPNV
jgi:hypothetical protein